MVKDSSLYNLGMKPLVYSEINAKNKCNYLYIFNLFFYIKK
jgi:hypothetical protein